MHTIFLHVHSVCKKYVNLVNYEYSNVEKKAAHKHIQPIVSCFIHVQTTIQLNIFLILKRTLETIGNFDFHL